MLCVHVYVEARDQDQVSFQYLGEPFTSPLFKKKIFLIILCVCANVNMYMWVLVSLEPRGIDSLSYRCFGLPVIGAGTAARAACTLNFSLVPTLFFETISFTKSWGLMA